METVTILIYVDGLVFLSRLRFSNLTVFVTQTTKIFILIGDGLMNVRSAEAYWIAPLLA